MMRAGKSLATVIAAAPGNASRRCAATRRLETRKKLFRGMTNARNPAVVLRTSDSIAGDESWVAPVTSIVSIRRDERFSIKMTPPAIRPAATSAPRMYHRRLEDDLRGDDRTG